MEGELLRGAPSLLFIGMPSVGKTTVGGLAAERLGLPFIDFDEVIVRRCGMTVSQIFELKGERYFRRLESDIAIELSSRGGLVLSPGGGIVESNANMEFLRARAVVCCLERDISLIDTRGRPLLKKPGAALELFRRRKPLYERYADFKIENNGSLEECVSKVVRMYLEAAL
ncbi:MAG: shikimate kinase [Clostridiaceae bacterium]|nr:shikimate kinase [Clostridiaceae bacterium]